MSEIEELIKSREPINQTELPLDPAVDDLRAQKLNVADGTFDPASRDDETGDSDEIELIAEDDSPGELSQPVPPLITLSDDTDGEEDGVFVDLDVTGGER